MGVVVADSIIETQKMTLLKGLFLCNRGNRNVSGWFLLSKDNIETIKDTDIKRVFFRALIKNVRDEKSGEIRFY